MANAYKILGQSNPSATTDTNLYVVPSSTQAVVSSVVVCNRDASDTKFRIALRPDGAVLADSHYIAYDADISLNETIVFTIGITLGDTDCITVYAQDATLTFTAFGQEIM